MKNMKASDMYNEPVNFLYNQELGYPNFPFT